MLKKIGLNLLYSFMITLIIAIGSSIYLLEDLKHIKSSLQMYTIFLPLVWLIAFLILTFQKQAKFAQVSTENWAKKNKWNTTLYAIILLVLIVAILAFVYWMFILIYQ